MVDEIYTNETLIDDGNVSSLQPGTAVCRVPHLVAAYDPAVQWVNEVSVPEITGSFI